VNVASVKKRSFLKGNRERENEIRRIGGVGINSDCCGSYGVFGQQELQHSIVMVMKGSRKKFGDGRGVKSESGSTLVHEAPGVSLVSLILH
jgi:hypothetical protein